jgi:hypothetical protein
MRTYNAKPMLSENQIQSILGDIIHKTASHVKIRLVMSLTIADCLNLTKTRKWDMKEELVYVIVAEENGAPIYVGRTRKGYARIYAHYTGAGCSSLERIIKASEPFSLGFQVLFFKVEGWRGGDNPGRLEMTIERLLTPWITTAAWNGGIRQDDRGYTPWYIQAYLNTLTSLA